MAECCTGQSECTELVTINYINSFIGNSIQDANGNPVTAKTSTTRPGNYCPTKTELTDGSIIPTFVDKGTNKWAQNVDGITVGNQGSYGANQPIKQSDLSMTYTRLNTFTITATPSTNISACGDDAKMTHTLKLTKTKKYLNSSCVATSSAETSADTTNVVTYTENVGWASIVNDTTVRIEKNPSSSSTRTLTVSGSTSFRGNRVTSTTITQKALRGGYADVYTDSSGLTKTIRCEGGSFDCEGGNYQANKIDVIDSWIVEMWEDECGVKHEDTARVKAGSHTTGEVITEIYRGSFAPCCDEGEITKTDSKTWPGYGTCSWTQTCSGQTPPTECGKFIVDGGNTTVVADEPAFDGGTLGGAVFADSCLLNSSEVAEPVFTPAEASGWITTHFEWWENYNVGCMTFPTLPEGTTVAGVPIWKGASGLRYAFPSPYSTYPWVGGTMLKNAGVTGLNVNDYTKQDDGNCSHGKCCLTGASYSQTLKDAVNCVSEWKLGSVFYVMKANTGATRTVKITWRVGGKECPESNAYVVTQLGPGEKKCDSNLVGLKNPLSYGSKTNVKIGDFTSTGGCSTNWTFTSNADWLTNITIYKKDPDDDMGEIHANLTQNTGSAPRTATVTGTLPGREGGSTVTFTVTQNANSATYYYYTVHSNITGATVVFNDIPAGRSYTYITDGSGNATHTTTSNVSSMSFTISKSYPASNSKYIWQNNGSGSAAKNSSTVLLGARIWGDQAKYAPVIFNPSGSLNGSCTTLHYEPTDITFGVSNQSSWIVSINISGGVVTGGNASAMSSSSGRRDGSFIATINGVSTNSSISVTQSDRCQ